MTDAKIGRYVATEFRSPLLKIFQVRRHGCAPSSLQSEENGEYEQLLRVCTAIEQQSEVQFWSGLLPVDRGALKANGIAVASAAPTPTLIGKGPFVTNSFYLTNPFVLNFVNER